MPTYEYLCKKCGHTFEEFQSMSEDPLTRCPECGTDNLARVMGTSGAIIFKGSGFYLTDYKKQQTPGGDPGKKGTGKKETGTNQAEKPPAEKGDAGKGTPGPQPPSPPPPEKKG